MKRPRLHISESGPEYEQFDKETEAYERAQEEAYEREKEEKEEAHKE